MKWFRHDSTANNDAKLQDLILEYGAEGYGVYWYCLELIAGNVSPDNLTFELEHDARIIARNLGVGRQRVEEIMSHMVNLGLFQGVGGVITCLKLAKRADDYTSKLVRSQVIENIEVLQTPTKSEKVPLYKNRLDKNRLNNNKKKTARFTPPTLPEVQAYVTDKNYPVDPNRFLDYYASNGWKVGRNSMKDWKAAVRGWASKENAKETQGSISGMAERLANEVIL